MSDQNVLAERFEANRSHLRAVAYRMLGSVSEADDAVQETWLRLSRTNARDIENLGGWLTTVVARICLDMLRSRSTRREEPFDLPGAARSVTGSVDAEPEHAALLAESVGLALLVLLESLEPAERVAFVLHDMFDVPFDEIAPIIGRSAGAARQVASRARRRARQTASISNEDFILQREVATAFRDAARTGDVSALLAVLDPDVVLRGGARTPSGEPRVVRGAANVAAGAVLFSTHAESVQLALVDGAVGLVWRPNGTLRTILRFRMVHARMAEIDIISSPEQLQQLEVLLLAD